MSDLDSALIKAEHAEGTTGSVLGPYCLACGQAWPCLAYRLAGALETYQTFSATTPNRKRPVRSVGVSEDLYRQAQAMWRERGESFADWTERNLRRDVAKHQKEGQRC